MKVYIDIKQAGKKKNTIEKEPFYYDNVPKSIKELLYETVKKNVAEFNVHNNEVNTLHYVESALENDIKKDLKKEIHTMFLPEMQEKNGKVTFGDRENKKMVDEEKAIKTAESCFNDGIIAVFVDGKRYEKLTDSINLHEESEITFVKLAMLAGRMW